jgi:hypothetical protein
VEIKAYPSFFYLLMQGSGSVKRITDSDPGSLKIYSSGSGTLGSNFQVTYIFLVHIFLKIYTESFSITDLLSRFFVLLSLGIYLVRFYAAYF